RSGRGLPRADSDLQPRRFVESRRCRRDRAVAIERRPCSLIQLLRSAEPAHYMSPVASIPVEYASARKIRERNKLYYRFNHWPIWILVFFIAPGPLTFDLFEHGFKSNMLLWLGVVLIGTGIAGLRGRLPGVEPR